MTDNEALNAIVLQVTDLNDFVAGKYDSVEGSNSQAVSLASPFTREASPNAVKTVITNIGNFSVRIFDGGFLVATVPPGGVWESPLSGEGEITVDTSGTSSTISHATYIKTPA